MDVLSTIRAEHRQVSLLIDEADECEAGDKRLLELAREIQEQLSLHISTEERLFYAPLRTRAEERDERVDVFEAYTEHTIARTLMEMLASGRKNDEKFKAELQVLGESVKHHVQEEESKVFAIAREYLQREELDEIDEAWERAKARGIRTAAGPRKKSIRGTTESPKAKSRR